MRVLQYQCEPIYVSRVTSSCQLKHLLPSIYEEVYYNPNSRLELRNQSPDPTLP